MKPLNKMLLLPLLALYACSGQDDDVSSAWQPSDLPEPATVRMSVVKAAPSFQDAGIQSLTVYVYKVERKGSVLFDVKNIDASATNFTYELPLGETYQTFAVANAAAVTDPETLETVTLHVNPSQENAVWISSLYRFSSDKSVTDVSLLLKRLVAEVNFSPAESADQLAAYTQFNRLDVTFKNVATVYHVKSATPELTDLTLTTTAAEGYQTRFYTFDTTSGDANTSVLIDYLKGDERVNTSSSNLDAGVKYTASHRYQFVVPVTNADFIATPWAASRGGRHDRQQMSVTESLIEN